MNNLNLYQKTPIEKLMDLKIDVAFHKVFSSVPQNNRIDFFNALLERNSLQKIQRIVKPSNFEADKNTDAPLQYIGFIRNGKKVILLVNFINQFDVANRSVYYTTKVFSEQNDNDLHSVIVINLLSYELLNQSMSYHTSYVLQEKQTHVPLNDYFEIHFIEYPKLLEAWESKKIDPWNDAKVRWLLLLAIIDQRNDVLRKDIYKEIELIALRDNQIRSVLERWKEVSESKEEQESYLERLKHILEIESAVRKAKQREDAAFKKGLKKKQVEIAKNMLDENIDIQIIGKITGLSLKEIQELNTS